MTLCSDHDFTTEIEAQGWKLFLLSGMLLISDWSEIVQSIILPKRAIRPERALSCEIIETLICTVSVHGNG